MMHHRNRVTNFFFKTFVVGFPAVTTSVVAYYVSSQYNNERFVQSNNKRSSTTISYYHDYMKKMNIMQNQLNSVIVDDNWNNHVFGRMKAAQCDDFQQTTTTNRNCHKSPSSNHIMSKDTAINYYKTHGIIPPPNIMHAVIPFTKSSKELNELLDTDTNTNDSLNEKRQRILVIGDIHGCYDELIILINKASIEYNDGKEFDLIISVGDLVNKGPKSANVVHYFRTTPRCLAIRGNHDDSAIKAVLDTKNEIKPKYQWLNQLSNDDIEWMIQLPYTIRLPKSILGNNEQVDTVIVHAGLIPNIHLDDQTIETMITIREVEELLDDDDNFLKYQYYQKRRNNDNDKKMTTTNVVVKPWASVWKGPYRVIFGHDARRGLQRYNDDEDNDWAIGLDSGCCYGKKLTGIILPERTIVQVDALDVHCPI